MGLARRRRSLSGLAAVLLILVGAPAAGAAQQTLAAGDETAGNGFGKSVAIDGRTAVVGAPWVNDSRGAVYVFSRFGDTWVQVARLTASDRAFGDDLGTSVAIDGDVIVAGAPGDGNQQGSAYTFARTGEADRQENGKLLANDGAGGAFLGRSVDIDGDTIVAGAELTDGDIGAVYTFNATGPNETTRFSTAKLTASDPFHDGCPSDKCHKLGYSVAIDGDTIVAGAPGHDLGTVGQQDYRPSAGAVYTFARSGGSRTQTAKLTTSDTSTDLGRVVAIGGDTIVAGGDGSAYTFTRTGSASRKHTARLTASTGAALGYVTETKTLAVEGELILAGASSTNGFKGALFVFVRTGGDRNELGALYGNIANAKFGASVAIDGDPFIVGAPGTTSGSNGDLGWAEIYFPTTPPKTPQCRDTTDNDDDGLADFPKDPGCESADDDSEIHGADDHIDCDDGIDNDGDGKIDYPDDPGCEGPTDPSELGVELRCDDGKDNDGDGRVDYPDDKGCANSRDGNESQPMGLVLTAPAKVDTGKQAKLVATLTPCPRLLEVEVSFQRKKKDGFEGVGRADAKGPKCKATISRRLTKKRTFRARTDRAKGYLGAISKNVTVNVSAPKR